MTAARTPTTFNGTSITAYNASFLAESGIGEVFASEGVTAEVAREFPTLVRVQPQGRALMLRVEIPTDTYANIQSLKQLFNTRRGAQTLVATDDNSVSLQISAAPLRMTPVEGYHRLYDVLLWCASPVWENATENDATHTIDSTAETITAAHVQNDGNDDVRPRFTYTAATTGSTYKTAATAYAKQRHVAIAVRAPLPHIDANANGWPIEITGGGWDVETKVKANELHPQGYDLRVFADGKEINRWLSNYGAGYGAGDQTLTGGLRTYEATGGIAYHAQKFKLPGCTSAETNTVDEVGFYLIRVNPGAALGGTMVCKIRADSNGTPGSVVTNGTSNTVNASSVGTGALAYTAFTFAANPVLNAKTWYWLELDADAVTNMDSSNYIRHGCATTNDSTTGEIGGYEGLYLDSVKHSNDETTWLSLNTGVGSHNAASTDDALAFRVFCSGTAKIWIAPELPARVKLTLATAMIAAAPSTVRVSDVEGTARLPDGRFCAVIDSEAIIFEKTAGTTDGLTVTKRGARGTTAASHSTGASLYLSDIDVRVVFGYYPGSDVTAVLGKGRYEPDELAPAIDGRVSTNSQFKIIGPHFNFGSEVRPILFRAEQDDSVGLYDKVSLDSNNANDLVNVTFKDAIPAGDYIARNTAVMVIPPGIEAGSAKITLDETIPSSLVVEHLLTNERGEEELVATHRVTDTGSAKTLTTTAAGYQYRLRVQGGAISGCDTADASEFQLEASSVTLHAGNTFTVDENVAITAAGIRIKRAAGRTFTATIQLIGCDADGVPIVGNVLAETASFNNATTGVGTTYGTLILPFTNTARVSAGVYWVGISVTAMGGAGEFRMSTATAAYARGMAYTGTASSGPNNDEPTRDIWFRVYGTPAQLDAPFGTNDTLDLDNFIIELDDTTPGTPLVAFQSADQDCWFIDGATLVRGTQSVSITAIMQAAETLDIDFENFTVTHSDDDLADQSYLTALSDFDEADPFKLAPGANTVVWSEAGLTGAITASLRTRFREAFL